MSVTHVHRDLLGIWRAEQAAQGLEAALMGLGDSSAVPAEEVLERPDGTSVHLPHLLHTDPEPGHWNNLGRWVQD